ncbi:MAG: GAF domain-containing protein, partial [Chloroflexi bacterium]|nr:GAF domain-containing protein [Chloroflexota bacterium]
RDITQRKQREEALHLRTKELEAQFSIAKILVQEGSFKEKVSRVLGELVQVAQGDLAILRVVDEKEQGLRLVAAVGEERQEVPPRLVVPYDEGIIGPTYLTGELAVINDYPSHPMAPPHVIAAGLQSMIIIPVKVSGRMLGILTINSMQLDHFTHDRVKQVTAVADGIGSLLENARLRETEQVRTQELESQFNIAKILVQEGSFEEKARKVLEAMVRIAQGDMVTLRTVDEKEQALRLVTVVGGEKQGFPPSPSLDINTSVSGEGYLTEKTLIINDYASHSKALPPVVEAGMKSMFVLPIKVGGRVLGILNIDSWELNHFTPERVRHITAVGDGLGALLENTRLMEGERLRTQELESQFNIAKILVRKGNFKEKVTRVLGELVQVAQGDLATLRVVDEKEQGLRLVAEVGADKQGVPKMPLLPYDMGIAGPAFLTGKPIVIDNYPSDPRAAPHIVKTGLQSMVAFPVKVGGRTLGTLNIDSWQPNHFTPERVRHVTAVADEIGALLENARLQEEAYLHAEELKRANEALDSRAQDLARSNADLEQFAYVASHDLQEPLRMISSYSGLLSQRYKDKLDTDAADFLGYITDGASRMQRLIQDLLAYSRAGSEDSDLVLVDCEEVLARVGSNLRLTIQESNAEVSHDPLPSVHGNFTQLCQLFQNLIGNAVKFRGDQPPQIHVGVESQGDHWLFSVRDNGIGISLQYKERIFTIFQRLHTKEEYPGTGIGLAICKKIVEKHGGNIYVESETGKGSTFYFTLPRKQTALVSAVKSDER